MNNRRESLDTTKLTVKVSFKPKSRRSAGKKSPDQFQSEMGNIPRLTRLMALAHRLEDLVRRGDVKDYADLASLGHVTRARMTQIMNLLNLAPDIQEEILFLPRTTKGRDPVGERDIRPIAAVPLWHRQRKMWKKLAGQRMLSLPV